MSRHLYLFVFPSTETVEFGPGDVTRAAKRTAQQFGSGFYLKYQPEEVDIAIATLESLSRNINRDRKKAGLNNLVGTCFLTQIEHENDNDFLTQALSIRDHYKGFSGFRLIADNVVATSTNTKRTLIPFVKTEVGLAYSLDVPRFEWARHLLEKGASIVKSTDGLTATAFEVARRIRVIRWEVAIALALVFLYNILEGTVGKTVLGETFRNGSYALLAGHLFKAKVSSVQVIDLTGDFDDPDDGVERTTNLDELNKLLIQWKTLKQSGKPVPVAVGIDVALGMFDRVLDGEVDSDQEIEYLSKIQEINRTAGELSNSGVPVFLAAVNIFPEMVRSGEFIPSNERLAHAIVGVRDNSDVSTLADKVIFAGGVTVLGLAQRVASTSRRKPDSPPFLDMYLEPDNSAPLAPSQIVLGPKFFVNFQVIQQLHKDKITLQSAADAAQLDLSQNLVIVGNDDSFQDPATHPLTGDSFSGLFLQAAAVRTKIDSPVYVFKDWTAELVSSTLAVVTICLTAFLKRRKCGRLHSEDSKLVYWIFGLQFLFATGLAIWFAKALGILWMEFLVLSFVAIVQLVLENFVGLGEILDRGIKPEVEA